jgi:hypothetical protein
MVARTPPWSYFDNRRKAPEPTAENELDELCARLFTTPDGKDWLELMWADKFDRSLDPEISEARLRHLEGQRDMLRDLMRRRERGLRSLQQKKAAS